MTTTPQWVPLVVAAIGLLGTVVGTVSGVLITQRAADRRERAAREHERERERDRWAREDALRNFEQQRDVYLAFYESLREMARTAYDHGMGLSEPPDGSHSEDGELPFEWNTVTFKKLDQLRVFASPEVLAAADTAYNACWRWGHRTRYGADDDAFYDRQEEFNDAELVLYDAIRRDLGLVGVVDPDGRPIPGSGWAAVEE